MKRILLSGITLLYAAISFAQSDTTRNNNGDTVRVGNFIIIRNNKDGNTNYDSVPPKRENYTIINIPRRKSYEAKTPPPKKTISTNYLVFDLGFANYNDKTDYGSPEATNFLHAPVGGQPFKKDDLKLITGKSSNVNLWLFIQKLNLANHVANLKYGLGLEMFNFRYKNNISYNNNPDFIYRDTIDFSKNKLYVGYLTVPFMINLNPTPNHHGFSLSAGVSAGYRIGSHVKQVSDERGKTKDHGDFNLDAWRFAYIGELGLGPVHLYGSYSIKPMFENAVKQYPYTAGIRFSNW